MTDPVLLLGRQRGAPLLQRRHPGRAPRRRRRPRLPCRRRRPRLPLLEVRLSERAALPHRRLLALAVGSLGGGGLLKGGEGIIPGLRERERGGAKIVVEFGKELPDIIILALKTVQYVP